MFAKYRCPHCEREWVEKASRLLGQAAYLLRGARAPRYAGGASRASGLEGQAWRADALAQVLGPGRIRPLGAVALPGLPPGAGAKSEHGSPRLGGRAEK